MNNIVEPLSRRRFKRKKAVYRCCVCGYALAPYFDDTYEGCSIIHDFGWKQVKGLPNGWICHHCAQHGFDPTSDYHKPFDDNRTSERTWDEWQEDVVEPQNKKLAELIKSKDPEFYHYEFENGWLDEIDWTERENNYES